MSDLKKTPLYESHVALGARMVGFAGWSMPVSYQSQIEEHHAVRRAAGMFDVSHMTIVDVSGAGARPYLERLLANDVSKLDGAAESICKALYTCMLDEQGGVIDDLIVYKLDDERYRLIVNAATREKDLAWLEQQADTEVELSERSDLALVAVQGPLAREAVSSVLSDAPVESIPRFSAVAAGEWLIARTGYTGEDGLEIMLPAGEAAPFWANLAECDVEPCGLGARDTLRLEAGLNLYGQDMDESVSPLECGLEWTVAFSGDRAFAGRAALETRIEAGVGEKQIGLILEGRGVLRAGYPVVTSAGEGVVTSGTFSPTLTRSIALARVPAAADGACEVIIRGRSHSARNVSPPFVRNGEVKVELEPAAEESDS